VGEYLSVPDEIAITLLLFPFIKFNTNSILSHETIYQIASMGSLLQEKTIIRNKMWARLDSTSTALLLFNINQQYYFKAIIAWDEIWMLSTAVFHLALLASSSWASLALDSVS